jgi:hypothetical protein
MMGGKNSGRKKGLESMRAVVSIRMAAVDSASLTARAKADGLAPSHALRKLASLYSQGKIANSLMFP